MNNTKLNYWVDSVIDALEEIGYEFSNENVIALAEDMMICADQESMAFGYDAIPNPLQTEVNRINDQLQRERDEWDRREYDMGDRLKQERRSWAIRENKYIQIIEDQEECK